MIVVNDLEGCGLILHCKSGSSSIRHALNDDWTAASSLEGRENYVLWNVVRNPYPRFVSAWWSHTPDKFPVKWEDYVDFALANPTEPHIISQFADSPLADITIVKLEEIEAMASVWRGMGIGIKTIHHLNASDPVDWKAVLSRGYRLQEILKFCEQDAEAYGYSF